MVQPHGSHIILWKDLVLFMCLYGKFKPLYLGDQFSIQADWDDGFLNADKTTGNCWIMMMMMMTTGWWFGTFFIFPYIFQRGSNHQPDDDDDDDDDDADDDDG